MAGSSSAPSPYSIGERVGALAIVVILAGIAGALLGLLGGYHFPKIGPFKGYHLKPVIKVITIPPLVAMIILGCVARNCFGQVTKPFPDDWASVIRNICLAMLLIRGGLQVSFAGKGLIVLILSCIPMITEANVIAWVGYGLFNMPVVVSYCLGFTIACISPSIVVPGTMSLNDQGYGRKKGISSTMIAAGTFDDISCIILFGIVSTITFIRIGGGHSDKGAAY